MKFHLVIYLTPNLQRVGERERERKWRGSGEKRREWLSFVTNSFNNSLPLISQVSLFCPCGSFL
jgi:hypothetical protein